MGLIKTGLGVGLGFYAVNKLSKHQQQQQGSAPQGNQQNQRSGSPYDNPAAYQYQQANHPQQQQQQNQYYQNQQAYQDQAPHRQLEFQAPRSQQEQHQYLASGAQPQQFRGEAPSYEDSVGGRQSPLESANRWVETMAKGKKV